MQKMPNKNTATGYRWPHWIRAGLIGIALAGTVNLAYADVTVCTEPGNALSLRTSFQASSENAIIVSDNNGQRIIGFNNFFGHGADSEWALGNGTWKAPQASERQCFRITGQHKVGPANPALPWQPSVCRITGNTISYKSDGEGGDAARVDILGGRIEAINPPCQPASGTSIDEMPKKQYKLAKPPVMGSALPPASATIKLPALKNGTRAQPPTAVRSGVAGDSAKIEIPAGAGFSGGQPGMVLSFKLPEFPFPPPDPSARLHIPNGSLIGSATAPSFGSVAARLEAALASNGYTELSYFAVPGGFTLVTQIERINPDATPSAEQRWNVEVEPVSLKSFSLEAYVRALLQKDAGFFRVIVFIFSSEPFTASGKKVPVDEAMKWIDKGANTLPRDVASQPYGDDMVCTALVYEFEIHTHGADAQLRKPSSHDGTEHLRASGILRALGE